MTDNQTHDTGGAAMEVLAGRWYGMEEFDKASREWAAIGTAYAYGDEGDHVACVAIFDRMGRRTFVCRKATGEWVAEDRRLVPLTGDPPKGYMLPGSELPAVERVEAAIGFAFDELFRPSPAPSDRVSIESLLEDWRKAMWRESGEVAAETRLTDAIRYLVGEKGRSCDPITPSGVVFVIGGMAWLVLWQPDSRRFVIDHIFNTQDREDDVRYDLTGQTVPRWVVDGQSP